MHQVQGQSRPDLLTIPWPLVIVPAAPQQWRRILLDCSQARTETVHDGAGWQSRRTFEQRRMQLLLIDSDVATFDFSTTSRWLCVEMLGGVQSRAGAATLDQEAEFDRLVYGEQGGRGPGASLVDLEQFRFVGGRDSLVLGGLGEGQVTGVSADASTGVWLTQEFDVELTLGEFVEPVRVRVGGHAADVPQRLSLVVESPDRYVRGRQNALQALSG